MVLEHGQIQYVPRIRHRRRNERVLREGVAMKTKENLIITRIGKQFFSVYAPVVKNPVGWSDVLFGGLCLLLIIVALLEIG